jgi:hypothetical protein
MAEGTQTIIVPAPKGIYLCDYVIGYDNGKTDLYGLFNAIRPEQYPYTQGRFCVFAQLVNGFGRIPFFVDIRDARDDHLIYTTETRQLHFPSRYVVIQMALSIEQCPFTQPGTYLVELFCDNTWVCDTVLQLREP